MSTLGTGSYLDRLNKRIFARQQTVKKPDPRYLAAEMAASKAPTERPAVQRSTAPLEEFSRMKSMAKSRLGSQFGAAREQSDLQRRRLLAAGGLSGSGVGFKIADKQNQALAKEQAEATNQAVGEIDVQEAGERERRYEFDSQSQEARRQFDAGLAFQKSSTGLQLMQNWDKMDLQAKEDVFNQVIALKEAKIKPEDIDRMKPIFDDLRADRSKLGDLNVVGWAGKGGENWERHFIGDPTRENREWRY